MEKKIAVSCPTKDLFKKVENKAFKMGITWFDKDLRHKDWWESYKENTCLDISTDSLKYSPEDFYQRQVYTIIPAKEWLKEFEVGDEVEIISEHRKGQKGKVEALMATGNIKVNLGSEGWLFFTKKDLELIKKGKDMTEHTVPLRVGDNVRVVGGVGDVGEVCKVLEIDYDRNYSSGCHHLVCLPSMGNQWKNPEGLELIPTEADIVVGSVWEHKYRASTIMTIKDFKGSGNCPVRIEENKGICSILFFLDDCKLIHRGDEEVKGEEFQSKTTTRYTVELDVTYDKPKQTNKKEKKMKRAEKVIKIKDVVFDRNCSNEGEVVGVFPESNQASYKDYNGGKVLTVSIDDLYLQFVAPKIVEVKPKKKKAKKKAKKKTTKKK